MTLDEILNKDFFWKNVLVIGLPASGKTYLTGLLKQKNIMHQIFHTDAYIEFGAEESLYCLIEDLGDTLTSDLKIVSGVLGYRLLRKGRETDCWKPDIVIECVMPEYKQAEIYRTERSTKSFKAVKTLNLGLRSILNEYKLNTPEKEQPIWLTWENNF